MLEVLVQGPRVFLRPWRPDDAAGLVELWSDGRVMRYVGFPNGLTVSEPGVREMIARARGAWNLAEDYYRFAVVRAEAGEFMGEAAAGQVSPDGDTSPDIKLLPRFWGQGYGREALALIVELTFAFTPAQRIVLEPHVENVAARRTYATAGFRQVGEIKRFDAPPPEAEPRGTAAVIYHDFVLTREDYLERRSERPRTG